MNSDRHVALYYAISGIGAVCHTVNPRLARDDIAYILAEAEDGLVFADPVFLPILAAVAPGLGSTLRGVVALCDAVSMPACDLPPAVAAKILGGQVVFSEDRQGQWVAVIEVVKNEIQNAEVRMQN